MVEVSVLTKNKAKNIDSQAKLPGAGHSFHLLLKIHPIQSTSPCTRPSGHGITHKTLLAVQVAGSGWGTSAEHSCVCWDGEGAAHWISVSVHIPSAATLHQVLCMGRWAVARSWWSPGVLRKPVSFHVPLSAALDAQEEGRTPGSRALSLCQQNPNIKVILICGADLPRLLACCLSSFLVMVPSAPGKASQHVPVP